jgi:hypothetical protein
MFIARPDVKAQQRSSGEYNPTVDRDADGNVTKSYGFKMQDLLAHINGERTYGHYLLNEKNECKFFAFDIDLDELNPAKPSHDLYLPTTQEDTGVWNPEDFELMDPRSVWLDRSKVAARNFLKYQMRCLANMLARTIHSEFEMQTAVTYTGAKGVHVYGFTGLMPAVDVRAGAEFVLDKLDCFEPHLGNNFFKHKVDPSSVEDSYRCFTIEVFPKQTEVKPGGYGNLMRLPLGRNLKNPGDPTFFVDMRTALTDLRPRDTLEALTTTDQWL